MGYAIFSTFVGAVALLGGWGLAWIHWRGQALAGAHRWAAERHLSVGDWSMATFRMHRSRPSIRFVALDANNSSFDVKLRFRVPVFDRWQLAEIECRPSGEAARLGALPLEG